MWNFKVRDVETPASTTFLLLFLLSVTQPLLWLDLNLTHKLDFWEDKTCLPTCWSRWCGGRSYIVCCLHRTGAACGTSLFFSHSSSLFLLSWRNYSIFLSRHFRFKTGGSTWSRIRLFSEGCTWKLIVLAVCWVPLLLSFSPASFPLQPPHPPPDPFLLHCFLMVNFQSWQLTYWKRRSWLCGKWDYETGLARPLLTLATTLRVHDTMQAIVTECMFGFISWHFRPRFLVQGLDMFDFLALMILVCRGIF